MWKSSRTEKGSLTLHNWSHLASLRVTGVFIADFNQSNIWAGIRHKVKPLRNFSHSQKHLSWLQWDYICDKDKQSWPLEDKFLNLKINIVKLEAWISPFPFKSSPGCKFKYGNNLHFGRLIPCQQKWLILFYLLFLMPLQLWAQENVLCCTIKQLFFSLHCTSFHCQDTHRCIKNKDSKY